MKRRNLILLLGLVALLGLSGCGNSKVTKEESEFNLSSRADLNETHQGQLAECNGLSYPDMSMNVFLSTFYYGNYYAEEIIRMSFSATPTDLIGSNSKYFQIFRLEETGAQLSSNSTAVSIYFQRKGTGQWLNQTPLTSVSRNSINSMIQNNSLDQQGIRVENFFDNVIMILNGMSLNFDALLIAFYDNSNSNQVYSTQQALLPPFAANPNTYIASHSSPDLHVLHPNYSLRDSGVFDNQFFTNTEQFCTQF